MIELTEEQRRELTQGEPIAIDPGTNQAYVLVRKELYDRLKELYDDSPWTDEEMDALAWDAGREIGWENMDEYDTYEPK